MQMMNARNEMNPKQPKGDAGSIDARRHIEQAAAPFNPAAGNAPDGAPPDR